MSQRLRRILRQVEERQRQQEVWRLVEAHAREAEIRDLVDAPIEEMIALCRTIHGYDGAPAQAEGYKAALERMRWLHEVAERRWEAGERPGPAPGDSGHTLAAERTPE